MGIGRPCSVCSHPERDAIDRRLIAGEGFAAIGRSFAVSADAVSRHRESHLPRAALAEAAEAGAQAEAVRGSGLLDAAAELRDKALALLRQAEAAGDLRTALIGVREAARCLELMARLAGELAEAPTVNILVAPQFVAIQAAIITALAPHPDARAAVLQALATVA